MASIKLYKPLLLGIMGMLCSILISPAVAQERKDKESIVPAQMFSPGDIGSYRKLFIWLAEGWLDPNQVLDADDNTTMHYLATNWQDLLRDAVRRGGACNRKNANGATPLHFAAAQGHAGPGLASILPLLRCGADPNLQDARGVTPVHAIYRSVKETNSIRPNRIEIELRGNTVNRSVKETAGIYTFGHVSTTNLDFDRECFPCQGGGRLDILRTLLAAGAKPNVKDNGGDTPLMLVVKYRGNLFTELSHVKTLLEHDADPNTRDKSGATPLIVVVGRDSNSTNWNDDRTVPIIKALLKGGADPDLRDSARDTPLIHAAKHEDDIVSEMKALLAGGADPCLRDRKGKVPWDYTDKGSGRWQLLSEAGGQVNRVTGVCAGGLFKAEQQEKKLKLARGVRRRIQSCLKQQGHDPGTPDGLFGPRTREAIRAWQIAQGQTKAATGFLTQSQADELQTACRVAVSPLCAGQTGKSCWMELSNRPGCYTWNPNPLPEETVIWSGSCRDGKVSGRGKVTWRYRKDGAWRTDSNEGEYRDGKGQDGHWVYYSADGGVDEGPRVNGKNHGLWVKRGSGRRAWVCFSNGERYGESACVSDVDRTMQVKTRTQLRIGPGASFSAGGVLEADEKVRVTAEAGEWLWIATEDGREGFVEAAALKEVEAKHCIVWQAYYEGRLGYWRGPCIDGLASGKGSAVLTAICGSWNQHGCVLRGKEQLNYYEGSAKHGLLSGHGILTGTGRYGFKLEGEFHQGAAIRGTSCSDGRPCQNFGENVRKIGDAKDPTCEFKVREQVAVYWLGSCVDGLASGGGWALGHDWTYVGNARDGRAYGGGTLTQYLDVDVNADPVNLFPSFKRTFSHNWDNGRVVGRVFEETLHAPPHYRGHCLQGC